MRLKELCELCYKIAHEKGFYDKYEESGRPISEMLMLIVTELGEACEADRKNNWDNFKEEIADTFIRLADMCGYLDIDIETEIEKKVEINKKRPYRHGKGY